MTISSADQRLIEARADFPILAQEVRPGVPLIYLDNAATTQKPSSVIQAIETYYRTINSNVHRGVHSFSERATAAYEQARKTVRGFVNAASIHEIIFTRNATEALNLVAYAWGLWALRPGDEIVLSEMEHHANIVPWQIVAERQGAVIRVIPITPDGRLDLDAYRALLTSGRVRMVAVAHVSNVLGTINDVVEITRLAHEAGAVVTIDGAQAAPHMAIDVRAIDAEFYALSGHKMCGPTGIGVLYGKRAMLDAMPPFNGGGSMIDRVSFEKTTFAEPPQKFEAGTPNIAGAIGLGAAIDYLGSIGLEAIHSHEMRLITYAMERLIEIPGVQVLGPTTGERAGLVAFTVEGVHPHDLSAGLDNYGIAVRAGHHCTMPLHEKLNIGASTRASFYFYNTFAEVDKLAEAVLEVRKVFVR